MHSSGFIYGRQARRWENALDVGVAACEDPILEVTYTLREWRTLVNACDYRFDAEIVARVTVMAQIAYFWAGKPDAPKTVRVFARTAANLAVMALRAGLGAAEPPDLSGIVALGPSG